MLVKKIEITVCCCDDVQRFGHRLFRNFTSRDIRTGTSRAFVMFQCTTCIYKLRSIGKQSGESVESVQRKKRKEDYDGKDLQRRKVLSLE